MITDSKKHLHLLYLPDETWERIKTSSEAGGSTRSDALLSLLKEPAPQTEYDKLLACAKFIQDYLESVKPAPSVTFAACAKLYLEEQRRRNKSSSVRTHKGPLQRHILPVFGERYMSDITRQELVDFVHGLSDAGLTPGYVNQILGTVKQVFALAMMNGYIEKNVAENVPRVPEQKSPARNTYHRALDKCKELELFLKELKKEHLYLFIMFMLYTGIRQGEASALTAEDVVLDEAYIYIRRTMITDEDNHVVTGQTTKTPSGVRKIPINDALRELLSQIAMPKDGSTIFKSARGNIVSNSSVNRAIRNTLKRLDEKGVHIEHFTSHALRDTFATYYAQANADKGGDLKSLQELMGHARLSVTTDLYLHSMDDTKRAGMARMEGFA